MKDPFVIPLPKNTPIEATAALYSRTFRDKKHLIKDMAVFGLKLREFYHPEAFIDMLNYGKINLEENRFIFVYIEKQPETTREIRDYNFEHEENYHYSPFSMARKELREKWSVLQEKEPVMWDIYLYQQEMKYQSSKK